MLGAPTPSDPAVPHTYDEGAVVANIKSQIKRNKQNEKRHERNKAVKTGLKSAVRKFRELAAAGDTDAAVKRWPRRVAQAGQGCLEGRHPKNQAANRKSAIAKTTASSEASRRAPSPRGGAFCVRSAESGGSRRAGRGAGDGEHQPLEGVRRVAGGPLDVGVGAGDRPDHARDPGVRPAA